MSRARHVGRGGGGFPEEGGHTGEPRVRACFQRSKVRVLHGPSAKRIVRVSGRVEGVLGEPGGVPPATALRPRTGSGGTHRLWRPHVAVAIHLHRVVAWPCEKWREVLTRDLGPARPREARPGVRDDRQRAGEGDGESDKRDGEPMRSPDGRRSPCAGSSIRGFSPAAYRRLIERAETRLRFDAIRAEALREGESGGWPGRVSGWADAG